MAKLFENKTLLTKELKELKSEECLKERIVGLLFAASWCPPSIQFMEPLNELYKELKQRCAPFEIVFISSDRTSKAMQEFYLDFHGNWLALDPRDPLGDTLREKYKITAIPKLVIVKESGDVISSKGRKDMQEKGKTCFRMWAIGANMSNWESIALKERKKAEETQSESESVDD